MGIGAYEAASLAASLRSSLIEQGESFVFETVLSDPGGAKVAELADASRRGMNVVMLFIRIDSPANLERAIATLPVVVIFDNTDLARPFRLEAVYRGGTRIA